MDKSEQVGIIIPEILIPEERVNAKKWAVIACDQYTSNEDYWIRTSKNVGGSPSTLHIILPEVFLRDEDASERIAHAKETMSHYIEDGVLVRLPKGVIIVERETSSGTRVGVMLAVDLEKYDVDYQNKPMIRATEQTVAERVPPRMKIREGAVLECPHVLLMINDMENSVIGPLYESRNKYSKVYDTPLMQNGGHVKGWFIDDEALLENMTAALVGLKEQSKDGMLFAVGDGNHSLLSAKMVWDQQKAAMTEEQRMSSPLRYALVEVVNLYDSGILMKPIHRVLFNVEPSNVLRRLVTILNGMGLDARMMYTRGARIQKNEGVQSILFESKMSKGRIEIGKPSHELMAVTLTLALDQLLKELSRAEIDYIHGDDEFHEMAKEHACLGFMMEPMTKEDLFDAIVQYGVLPRKAFSLGQADEKRFYFECRLLVEAKEAPEPEEEAALQQPDEPQVTEPSEEQPEKGSEAETDEAKPDEIMADDSAAPAASEDMVIEVMETEIIEEPAEEDAFDMEYEPRPKKSLFRRKRDKA